MRQDRLVGIPLLSRSSNSCRIELYVQTGFATPIIRKYRSAVATHGIDSSEGGVPEITLEHDAKTGGVWATSTVEGMRLRMLFKDWTGEGDVLKLRIAPAAKKGSLRPEMMRYLGQRYPVLVEHARASLAGRKGDATAAVRALRAAGKTARGLGDQHYQLVAEQYVTLVKNGERAPIKALAGLNHVTISAASRWVKEARRRGYVPDR